MKKNMFIVTCLFFSLLFVTPSLCAEGEGRYQLYQGKYSYYDGAQGIYVETNGVFLLDTVTGDASILVSSTDEKGRRVRYWEPVAIDETQGPQGF